MTTKAPSKIETKPKNPQRGLLKIAEMEYLVENGWQFAPLLPNYWFAPEDTSCEFPVVHEDALRIQKNRDDA